MNILVTGYKGFIGKHMTKLIKEQGHNVLGYEIDNTDEELIDMINKCDAVIHLAGINRPLTTEEFYNGNTNFTKKLVDLIKDSGKNLPIVMSSSIQAALDNDYGKSKKMGEDYVFNSGLPCYVFRLANVFGKWCRPNYNSAAATFMYNIANSLPIEIRDRSYVVHYNYVEDIVKTFLKCVTGDIPSSHEILSVTPVFDCSLGRLADLLYSYKDIVESDKHIPDINDEFEFDLFVSFLDYLKDDEYNYNYASDPRGSFEEIYKNKKYGQISLNSSFPGIVKGGHYHTYKNEIFMTVKGECVTRLRDINSKNIEEYPQHEYKSNKVYIHPGYTHDIKNVGEKESVTIMWISEIYSDNTPDTFRELVDL